jgi:cell division protein FtsL
VGRGIARRKPKRSAAFWVFSLMVVGGMALALTVMSALVAQSAFRLQQLTNEQAQLAQSNGQLRLQVADLSAPQRVSTWAIQHGLTLPTSHQIIHLPPQPNAASSPAPRSTITQTIAAGGTG